MLSTHTHCPSLWCYFLKASAYTSEWKDRWGYKDCLVRDCTVFCPYYTWGTYQLLVSRLFVVRRLSSLTWSLPNKLVYFVKWVLGLCSPKSTASISACERHSSDSTLLSQGSVCRQNIYCALEDSFNSLGIWPLVAVMKKIFQDFYVKCTSFSNSATNSRFYLFHSISSSSKFYVGIKIRTR